MSDILLCPRCGKNALDPDEQLNSLSRHKNGVYICNACGHNEAMLDLIGQKPFASEHWASEKKD